MDKVCNVASQQTGRLHAGNLKNTESRRTGLFQHLKETQRPPHLQSVQAAKGAQDGGPATAQEPRLRPRSDADQSGERRHLDPEHSLHVIDSRARQSLKGTEQSATG